MRSRALAIGAAGVLFVVAAGTVLLLQVRVHASGVGASCGAPFDVISGRADWQAWYAADLADPRVTPETPLVRTERCPTAVNRRTAAAATLAVIALAAGATAGALIARNRRPRPRPARLRTLGVWVMGIGAGLTSAGVIALVILLANPRAALYLYVDRWVIAVVGVIILIPAIALAAGGRALMIVAETRDEQEIGHAPP